MFIRQDLNTDLDGLHDLLVKRDDGKEEIRVDAKDIHFHLDDTDPHITLGSIDVPAGERALLAVGDLTQVPGSFLKRANKQVQGSTLNALMNDLLRANLDKDARVTLRGSGDDRILDAIVDWNAKKSIDPGQIVDVATKVIDGGAKVTRLIDDPGFFGFDVYAPDGTPKAYGGEGIILDGENEVNDITAGGLRFGMDIKHGLAPFTQTYLYRLWCTNGMDMEHPGLKVDARGSSVEEVLAELEAVAELAFSYVERDIASFYDLKTQRVENVERAVRAIARERGIPDRSTIALIDLAAGDDMPDDPTLFDVVNLVTNYANAQSRDGGRLLLESAGGSVINDHAARCGHCQQKVR